MLEMNQVYCGYNNNDICKDITVAYKKGLFTSIIGPNGAGKTTLLKAIGGIIPYRGEITIDNTHLSALKGKAFGQKIAMLSQMSDIYFSYSIYDTVMLGRYPYFEGFLGIPSKKDREIVIRAMKHVGLLDIKDKMLDELSGGQLQRVFLARTLAQEPEIILLDEPTNHLDFKHQIDILDYVKEWAIEEDKTVIAVLHDLNLVQKYSDYVILLKEGHIFSKGTPKDVLSSYNFEEVYKIDVKKWMQNALSMW